jgi:group I intron endonuclease
MKLKGKTIKNVVYKVVNMSNGKIYIGITTKKFGYRVNEHKNRHKATESRVYSTKFYRALRRYGFDNFEWEILDRSFMDNKEDAWKDLCEKEKHWISHYNSYNKGYNSTLGGEGNLGADTKGTKNPRCQPVVKLTKEGEYLEEYEFISDALESLGQTDISHIVKCCRGKLHMAYGYKWMYKDNYEKFLKGDIKIKVGTTRFRSVVQLTTDYEYLTEYTSLKNAGLSVGGQRYGIGKCCKGEQEVYMGYRWFYKDEYMKMK